MIFFEFKRRVPDVSSEQIEFPPTLVLKGMKQVKNKSSLGPNSFIF